MYFLLIVCFTHLSNCLQTTEVNTKNITCVSTQGQESIYVMVEGIASKNDKRISSDTYIPKNKTLLFICSNIDECSPVTFTSLTELTASLKSCFINTTINHTYLCINIRFNESNHMKKLSFLNNTIPDKSFHLFNCLVKSNGTEVCHKIADDTHTEQGHKLKQTHASVIDNLICEEGEATNDKNDHVDFATPSRRQVRSDTEENKEETKEGIKASDSDQNHRLLVKIGGILILRPGTEFVKKSRFQDSEVIPALKKFKNCTSNCMYASRQRLDLHTR